MMVIPLLILILFVYFIVRNPETRTHMPKSSERSPLDILKQRYAEGYLSQDEFLSMREELGKEN